MTIALCTSLFDEQKTSFLSVSLDALKIHFRIFIFSDFFETKNIFFVFHALKIIIYRVSIKPVSSLAMFLYGFCVTKLLKLTRMYSVMIVKSASG